MRRFYPLLVIAIALLGFGCGNDRDDFVVTNTNNNVGVGPAARLAFVTNPAQTTNTDFTVAPIVEVQDANGNRILGDTRAITVSLVNPGAAVLNGTTTRNAIDGRATFPGLSVSIPGTYTLRASSGNLTAGDSNNFVVNPRLALYAVQSAAGDGDPSRLVELNPSTGELVGVLGEIGDGNDISFIADLICLPDGSMFAHAFGGTNTNDLISVNPANPGASTIVGTIDDFTNFFVQSLAYDSNTQTCYALVRLNSGENQLGTLNLTTAAFTALPNGTGINNGGGNGLAFDESTGNLFWTNSTDLYQLNTTTGAATLIGGGGTLNLDNRGIRGIDFNPNTNALVAAGRGNGGLTGRVSEFGTINTTTGVSTRAGTAVNVTGIAYCSNATLGAASPLRQTGYTVESITQNFVDISGTGTALMIGNDNTSDQALGFTFNFAGVNFTDLRVSSEGFVTFDLFAGAVPIIEMLSNEDFGNNTLALWHDDLDPSLGGDVFVETRGTAPNRTFIIQWSQTQNENAPGGGIDAQIVLYEGTNVIEYHYADVTFGNTELDGGGSAVVGIQIDGVTADLWSAYASVLTNTTAIRFTPPTP